MNLIGGDIVLYGEGECDLRKKADTKRSLVELGALLSYVFAKVGFLRLNNTRNICTFYLVSRGTRELSS